MIERIIEGLQNDLAQWPNDIYLSEADFQFAFAEKAKEFGATNVIVEYPYVFNEENTRKHIDVYFQCDGTEYFIELKYKTKKLDNVTRFGEPMPSLRDQAAGNDAMYSFRKDVVRMETLLAEKGENTRTFCLFLTNSSYIWNNHNRGENVNSVSLANNILSGPIKYESRGKIHHLTTNNEYILQWNDFKRINNREFKYLLVECR